MPGICTCVICGTFCQAEGSPQRGILCATRTHAAALSLEADIRLVAALSFPLLLPLPIAIDLRRLGYWAICDEYACRLSPTVSVAQSAGAPVATEGCGFESYRWRSHRERSAVFGRKQPFGYVAAT